MRALLGLATVVLALAATGAAQARERVATQPPADSMDLALSGERVAWVAGSLVSDSRVLMAAPGEQPRTLASFGFVDTDHQTTFQYVRVDASPSHVAALRSVVGVDGVSEHSAGRITVVSEELWAGRADAELTRIASCEPGGSQRMLSQALAVSGTRVVTGDCLEPRGLVVRDLATGLARPVVRGGPSGEHVDLAGRFLAWEEHERQDDTTGPRTIVVHDLDAAADAYRVHQPRFPYTSHGAFHVQDDGKLLDTQLSDSGGRYAAWYSPQERFEHRLIPAGLRLLFGDRSLGVHDYGDLTDLTVHGLDGSFVQVARMSQRTLAGSDFDGARVAWAETRCGATALYTQRLSDPFSVSRSTRDGRCPRVSVPGSASVSRRGILRLPLRCRDMPRCVGTIRLVEGDKTVAKARFDFGRRRAGSVILRPRTSARTLTARVTEGNGLILAERKLALRR